MPVDASIQYLKEYSKNNVIWLKGSAVAQW